MKKIATALSTGLLLAGLTHADTNEQQIETLISKYQTALNNSQTTEVLKLYGDKPVFMPQHAPAQIGRQAIENAYNQVFNTIDLNITFSTHEIDVLGDTAWARTSSAGKTKILGNNLVIDEANNELFIFKNEKGEWKIHQYIFSTNQQRK